MDAASQQILSYRSDIIKQSRILKRVFSTLDEREVEAMCWESMWRAIPKAQEKDLPVVSVYYWQVRSDLQTLMKWYSRRHRLVSFIDEPIVIEHLDSPENYLDALQTIERTRRPLRGLLTEVMEGLGIGEAYAKTRLRAAKKTLGLDRAGGAGRYSDEEKLRVLAYLGIDTDTPEHSAIESGGSGSNEQPCPA